MSALVAEQEFKTAEVLAVREQWRGYGVPTALAAGKKKTRLIMLKKRRRKKIKKIKIIKKLTNIAS